MAAPLSPKETRTRQIVDAIRGLQQAPAAGVDTANSPNAGEIARFTDADTIEGLTEAEFKAAVNLEIGTDVQAWDADLDTWAGVTPSANGQSLVAAANYAAMRALLDLEAGTDFLSPAAIAAAYQPLDAGLTSIAGLTTAADRMIYTTGSDTYAVATLTAFARSILDDADEATFKATVNLEIGTDVQAYDADLAEIAALSNVAGDILYTNSTPAWTRLAKGSDGDVLTLASGLPSWAAPGSSGGVDIQIFTTTDTWDKPGSGTYAFIRIWGAGGGGGRAGSTDGGGGGGGGAYTERWVLLSALSSSETVTIGAGGGGATSDETEGTVGGDSSFGSVVTAYGGGGGRGSTSNAGGGGGGGGQAGAGATPGAAPDGGNGGLADGGGYSRGSGGSGAIGGDGKFGIGGGGGGGGNISGAGFRGGDGLEGGGGGGGGGTSDGGQGGSSHRGGAGGGGGGGTTATASIGGYCHLFALRGGDGKTGSTVGGDGALFCGGGGTESGNAGDGGDGLCIVMVF